MVVNSVIDSGKKLSQQMKFSEQGVPLMWSWHRSLYFGGAHGVSGIIYTLLLTLPHVNNETEVKIQDDSDNGSGDDNNDNNNYNNGNGGGQMLTKQCPHLKDLNILLTKAIDGCIKFKFPDPSSNFASSTRSLGQNRDNKVQWCHGAPGFISMYCQALKTFSNDNDRIKNRESWVELTEKACNKAVWNRGLLCKGSGLCHGVSGNGYSFLSLYRCYSDMIDNAEAKAKDNNTNTNNNNNKVINDLKEKKMDMLYKAFRFAEVVTDTQVKYQREPDRPFSLFEGSLGGCIFLIDLIFAPETSSFPCFEYNL